MSFRNLRFTKHHPNLIVRVLKHSKLSNVDLWSVDLFLFNLHLGRGGVIVQTFHALHRFGGTFRRGGAGYCANCRE